MAGAYAVIRQAIIDKDQITCTYDDYDRELCPHAIGLKDRKAKVLCYQFGGQTSTGPIGLAPPQKRWKCLSVERMENVQAKPGPWHSVSPHSTSPACIDKIDVEVDY